MKFDASSLPVCLVTLKGRGTERSATARPGPVHRAQPDGRGAGASVPPAFGGRYRQIMVYVDPLKLEAHQLSVMDVVRNVNEANLILPAGDVKIGPYDYNVYANSQINAMKDINLVPLKTRGRRLGAGGGRGQGQGRLANPDTTKCASTASPRSICPSSNRAATPTPSRWSTASKRVVSNLLDVPKQLVTQVVFDQSVFVKAAIENLIHEGAIGLVLTGADDSGFSGQHAGHGGGLSLHPAFGAGGLHRAGPGRQHRQHHDSGRAGAGLFAADRQLGRGPGEHFPPPGNGRTAEVAAERGGQEVALPVLAATLTTGRGVLSR